MYDDRHDLLQYLPHLTSLTFPETTLTAPQVDAIRESYPELTVRCSVNILGTLYDAETTQMDLSALKPEQIEELLPKLGLLNSLTDVMLMTSGG